MLTLRRSEFFLFAITLANIVISILGANIGHSVSVSVRSSSNSKSQEKTDVDITASPRSLNHDDSFEREVEISAPYAKKVINSFPSEEKSRNLKDPIEAIEKNDKQVTTENLESEQEVTIELNENVWNKILVNKNEMETEGRGLIEWMDDTPKSDEKISTEKPNSSQETTTELDQSNLVNESLVSSTEAEVEDQNPKDSNESTEDNEDKEFTTENLNLEREGRTESNQSNAPIEVIEQEVHISLDSQSLEETSEAATEEEEPTSTEIVEIEITEESIILSDSDEQNTNGKAIIDLESISTEETVSETTQSTTESEKNQNESSHQRRKRSTPTKK